MSKYTLMCANTSIECCSSEEVLNSLANISTELRNSYNLTNLIAHRLDNGEPPIWGVAMVHKLTADVFPICLVVVAEECPIVMTPIDRRKYNVVRTLPVLVQETKPKAKKYTNRTYSKEATAYMRPLGIVIRRLRVAKGVTQEVLGKATGVGRGHITRMEGGERLPSLAVLIDIAKYLGTDAVSIIEEAVPRNE